MDESTKGIIWSDGIHHVYADKKPVSLQVPKETIPETFQIFQDEIDRNGGITLGLDHIPDELLKQYPILKKLDVLNVGKITEISHDDHRIYATKSTHTNPLVAELYLNGELPAYSVVADSKVTKCPTGQADFVLKKFKNIKRTDYVDEGGCQDCKTGIVPKDIVITAKLSMEAEIMANDSSNGGNGTDGSGTSGNGNDPDDTSQDAKLDQIIEMLQKVADALTQDEQEDEEEDAGEPDNSNDTKVQAKKSDEKFKKLEARTAAMELRAKKAEYAPIVDNAIKEGKVLPVDRDVFVNKGVEVDDIPKFTELMAKRPVIFDFEEYSRIEAKDNSSDNNKPKISMEEFRASRSKNRY